MELTTRLKDALTRARRRAIERRQAFCDCEQVLEALLEDSGDTVPAAPVRRHLDDRPELPFEPPSVEFARTFRLRVLPAAEALAAEQEDSELDVDHVLTVLLGSASPVAGTLRQEVVAQMRRGESRIESSPPRPTDAPRVRRPATPDSSQAGAAEALLETLAPRASDDALVDRTELVDRVLQTLLFGNPLLLGPPGSGRRSLIRLVVRRLHDGRCPHTLREARLVELDPSRLVAGTSYRGELEERLQRMLAELRQRGGRPVIVIEDLHLVIGTGNAGGPLDVASVLLPALRGGEIQVLGCCTPDQRREYLEKNPAWLAQLSPVSVQAPDPEEATRLLERLPVSLESSMGVSVAPEAVRSAIDACERHLPHQALPGAAEKLLRGATATLAFETSMLAAHPDRAANPYWRIVGGETSPSPHVGERHVLHALSQIHGIPFEHLDRGVVEKIHGFDRAFRADLFGQDHVLETLRRTVAVALMNLADARRPRGRLFFLGPPGTGKTECARLLARHLMGREEALLRFDMSEFQEPSSVATLLGSDKGLVGSEEGGRLTEPLRTNPHRVILFDEIEKAHPNVFNVFLQILDNGEIHDRRGRRVSFRHALLVFTSNEGCDGERGLFGCSRREITARLQRRFRPEFLDRIEVFVPFAPLGNEARRRVAEQHLDRLRAEVRRAHGVALEWEDALLSRVSVAQPGQAGVRNILRWIQSDVKPAVVFALLGRDPSGDHRPTLRLDLAAGNEVIARIEEGSAAEVVDPS